MVNYESKYWTGTWQTNVVQKKLPTEKALKHFLDKYCDDFIFQKEKGTKLQKDHYQISIQLDGPRKSKKSVLNLFREYFDNVNGLTLAKTHSKTDAFSYCSKEETRVGKTYRGGKMNNYDEELAEIQLRQWQQDLVDYISVVREDPQARDRQIIWVGDSGGNTGKSKLVKWLVAGQRELIAHKLPVSSVDRLISAVTKINKIEQTDLFLVDLTRSKGKDQSFGDLFAAIEDIKNGHIVDMMYGNYVEQTFKPPLVAVFTNLCLSDHEASLSRDRWLRLEIRDGELEHLKFASYNGESLYTPLREITKKLSDTVAAASE